MTKFLTWFSIAACLNGAGWWSVIIAETTQPFMQLVHLGGTGGLIVCLVTGLTVLWRQLAALNKEKVEADKRFMETLLSERNNHRDDLEKLRRESNKEVEAVTEKYLSELRSQIDMMRNEMSDRLQDARETSDAKYKPQQPDGS